MKKDQSKRKIGIDFSLPDSSVKHCSGIEAMQLTPSGKLFTASRDATIKRWNVASSDPTFEVSLEGHTDWVNDLAFLPHHDLLVSCSNDRTVRLWKASSDQPGGLNTLSTLMHHTDYVTCLSVAQDKGLLCSAGLRGELFTIDPATGTATRLYPKPSIQDQHPTAKGGPVRNAAHTAFGGLGASLWGHGGEGGGPDSKDSSNHDPSQSHSSATAGGVKGKGQKASIYALSCSPDGALVAFGGPDHIIRLWDPRSRSKVDKLRGHTDTLRALALSPTDQGRQALSASSDGTVRLWDIGMRRCIESHCAHTDSVWCLAATEDFSRVVSGGRDGTVHLTLLGGSKPPLHHPSNSHSYLVAKESRPVRCLALDLTATAATTADPVTATAKGPGAGLGGYIWVGTESSHINQYPSPLTLSHPPASTTVSPSSSSADGGGSGGGGGVKGPGTPPSPSPTAPPSPIDPSKHLEILIAPTATLGIANFRRASKSASNTPLKGREGDKAGPEASRSIPGLPSIIRQKVLGDRRHVLTLNSTKEVQLWDVLSGGVVESFGAVDFASKETDLFEPLSVPTWFQPDIRLGRLGAVLEPPSCFFAEEYASSLGGCDDSQDDLKVNLGRMVLEGVLRQFKLKRLQLTDLSLDRSSSSQDPSKSQPPIPWPKYWTTATATTDQFSQSPRTSPTTPSPWERAPHVFGLNANGLPFRLRADCFTGGEEDHLPPWVVDVVLRGVPTVPKESKCPFVLQPFEGSRLPMLRTSRLNAPRILQVHKVYAYCQMKLREEGVEMSLMREPHPKGGQRRHQGVKRPSSSPDDEDDDEDEPEASSSTTSSSTPPSQPYLELLCNGQGVPYDMNLASVRAYLWKKPSEDLVFHFRRLDPKNPAHMPTITPPTNN